MTTYAVGGLSAADIDLIALALDRYISEQPSDSAAEQLLLKFDDITDPVENDLREEVEASVTGVRENVISVNFRR